MAACILHYEKAVPDTYVQDDLQADSDTVHDDPGTAAGDNTLVPRVDEAEHMAFADDPLLVWPLLVGNGVEASKATVVEDIAAAVVSCLEVDHGACWVIQGDVQAVVAYSCQEAEAAPASARKKPCSQH